MSWDLARRMWEITSLAVRVELIGDDRDYDELADTPTAYGRLLMMATPDGWERGKDREIHDRIVALVTSGG
jgi:hypothetical protein